MQPPHVPPQPQYAPPPPQRVRGVTTLTSELGLVGEVASFSFGALMLPLAVANPVLGVFGGGLVLVAFYYDLQGGGVRIDSERGYVSTWQSRSIFRWARRRRPLDRYVAIDVHYTDVIYKDSPYTQGRKVQTIASLQLVDRQGGRLTVLRTASEERYWFARSQLARLTGLEPPAPFPRERVASEYLNRSLVGSLLLAVGVLGTGAVIESWRSEFTQDRLAFAGIAVVLGLFPLLLGRRTAMEGFSPPAWATEPPLPQRPRVTRAIRFGSLGCIALILVTSAAAGFMFIDDPSERPAPYVTLPTPPEEVSRRATDDAGTPPSADVTPPLRAPARPPLPTARGLFEAAGTWACRAGRHRFEGLTLNDTDLSVYGTCEMELTRSTIVMYTRSAVTVGERGRLVLRDCRVETGSAGAITLSVNEHASATVIGGSLRPAQAVAVWASDSARVELQGVQVTGSSAVFAYGRARVSVSGSTVSGSARISDRARIEDGGGNTGLTLP